MPEAEPEAEADPLLYYGYGTPYSYAHVSRAYGYPYTYGHHLPVVKTVEAEEKADDAAVPAVKTVLPYYHPLTYGAYHPYSYGYPYYGGYHLPVVKTATKEKRSADADHDADAYYYYGRGYY